MNKEVKMTHDEAEDFLSHYGKMGMKWGHRRTPQQIQIHKQDKARLKSLDKKAREKNSQAIMDAHNKAVDKERKQILAARKKLPATEQMLRDAKIKYKKDREQIGKVAAKTILNTVRDKAYATIELANRPATNQELVLQMVQDYVSEQRLNNAIDRWINN